eukprot:2062120-Karenia_brevis.AAC.1
MAALKLITSRTAVLFLGFLAFSHGLHPLSNDLAGEPGHPPELCMGVMHDELQQQNHHQRVLVMDGHPY